MPWTRPSLTTLISRIQSDITSRLTGGAAILRRSMLYILARAFAGAVHILHGFLEFIALQVFITTAEAEYLDGHGSTWGVTRLAANFAVGDIEVTGDDGTIIPANTIWVRDDGIEFVNSAAGLIASGVATISLTCRTAGETGNSDTGGLLTLQSPIAGADDTATVLTPGITGGTDQETDAELRTRILARIQNPPTGGSETDYKNWARSISGIANAWVYPNYTGAGTVAVAVKASGVNPVPSGPLVTQVQDYIDEVRPVTAIVTVSPIDAVNFDFDISISPNTSAIRSAVEASLAAMLADDGVPGGTVLISHITEAILTSGVEDFVITNIDVDGSPVSIANIPLSNFEYPVLDTINFATL